MNRIRYACRRVGEAAARGNQAPPQATVAGVQVPVNPAALTNGLVRDALVQMAQTITTQPQSITAQTLERVLPRRTQMLAPWLAD